jgi:diacylglycerol kinase (ATP)
VNRYSGAWFSQKKIEAKTARFYGRDHRLDYVFPDSGVEATGAAYMATREGAGSIMVWGGDGSVNAVLQGVMRGLIEGYSAPELILLGGGSGSDFIRTLTSGKAEGRRLVDIGRVESIPGGEIRFFMNGFSVGVTAEIAALKGAIPRWLPGSLKYMLATFIRLSRGKLFFNPAMDGRQRSPLLSVMILNGQFVGGGMRILKDTSVDDGCLERVVVPAMGIPAVLHVFKSVYLSGLSHHRDVEVSAISQACEIRLPHQAWCETDGETFAASHLRISILTQAIMVRWIS